MMTNQGNWRQSFNIPGANHGTTPIPSATRVGNMLFSSGLMGADPLTGELSADAQAQVKQAFLNLDAVLNTAGSCLGDVAHLTVSLVDISIRDHVNREWLQRFPDPNSRPARHTNVKDLRAGMLVQLEVVAVINGTRGE